jgi:DNA-binding YbaB/EbfC family protein
MSSLGKLMKQAQRMQRQMEEIQTGLAARTVEATGGGGAVKVVARCDGSLVSIKLDPQAVNPQDVPFLEDLVLSTTNKALADAKQIYNDEMARASGGFSIPGMM